MNLTSDIQVAGPFKLGDLLIANQIVLMFRTAQAAGDIPADRSPLDPDDGVLWILDAGKVVAAAVFGDYSNGRMWLDFLYTDEPLRNRGLGRALLKRLTEVARERGYKRILLGTDINNAAMRHLAQRVGFVEDSINLAIEIGKDVAACPTQ